MTTIPKTIHYCWFGGNPLGAEEERCIESWRKYLPGYEIKRWDESNFDVRCCAYVSEAYDAKKWAFVSDYARFKILYDGGGLYFDTDVEVIKPIDDIIAAGPFMGIESDAGKPGIDQGGLPLVAPGLGLASQPGSDLYREVLDSYEHDHFLREDGSYNQKSVVFRTTEILRTHGLVCEPGFQRVAGVSIYPAEFFNPKDYDTGKIEITVNTRSIHHFKMSWFTPQEKFQHGVMAKLLRLGIGDNMAGHLSALATTVRYLDFGRVVNHFKDSDKHAK